MDLSSFRGNSHSLLHILFVHLQDTLQTATLLHFGCIIDLRCSVQHLRLHPPRRAARRGRLLSADLVHNRVLVYNVRSTHVSLRPAIDHYSSAYLFRPLVLSAFAEPFRIGVIPPLGDCTPLPDLSVCAPDRTGETTDLS